MNFFQNDVSHHIHVMKSLFIVKKCVALQVARNFSYVARKKKLPEETILKRSEFQTVNRQ